MNKEAYIQHQFERLTGTLSSAEVLDLAERLGQHAASNMAHVAIHFTCKKTREVRSFHKFVREDQTIGDAYLEACCALEKEHTDRLSYALCSVNNITAGFKTSANLKTHPVHNHYYLVKVYYCSVEHVDVEISFSGYTTQSLLPPGSNSRHAIEIPVGTPMSEAIQYLDASIREVAEIFGLTTHYRENMKPTPFNTPVKSGSSYSIVIS